MIRSTGFRWPSVPCISAPGLAPRTIMHADYLRTPVQPWRLAHQSFLRSLDVYRVRERVSLLLDETEAVVTYRRMLKW